MSATANNHYHSNLLLVSFLLTTMFFPVLLFAKTAYITDKVIIDVHDQKHEAGQTLKSLPSGSSVTIVKEEEGYSQIKTKDKITGWVASKYLSNEKPTQLEYLSLVSKYKAAQQKIRDYENRLLEMQELRREAKSADWLRNEINLGKKTEDRLERALHEKDTDIAQLNHTINNMQRELDDSRLQINEVLESVRIQSGEQQPSTSTFLDTQSYFSTSMSIRSYVWLILSLMVTLIIGVLMGFIMIDYKIRKKHGDAPLY